MRTAALRHGFTLVEMALSMAILGVLAISGLQLIFDSSLHFNQTVKTLRALEASAFFGERVAREFREATTGNGASSLLNMSATAPAFTRADYRFTNSGSVTNGTETTVQNLGVTISKSGNVVRITYSNVGVAGSNAFKVAGNDSNLNVTDFQVLGYYDGSGNPTANAGSARAALLSLTVQDPVSLQSTTQKTFTTLRNCNVSLC